MRLIIYTDNTLPIPIKPLTELLNSVCEHFDFNEGDLQFRIEKSTISCPLSYDRLPKDLLVEASNYDYAFLCTNVPYENNQFFESHQCKVLISFSGWNLLTDLPIINGVVYFIAAILTQFEGIGRRHDENIGCINDVWWDKRGVNLGMRAAFICPDCFKLNPGRAEINKDIISILDLVSKASRIGKDVLSVRPAQAKGANQVFDVFICHNSDDKPFIRQLNSTLKNARIKTWFDEDQLEPGLPWQPLLEKQIESVAKAAVFVGSNGIGPWQNVEVRAFLSEFANRGCPVIPVILEDAKSVPELPIFLRQMTWIDLRIDYEQNLLKLIKVLSRK